MLAKRRLNFCSIGR
jgi:hypothetical protein